MNPLVAAIVEGVLRHALSAAGGWLVAQGWISSSQETAAIGALVTLAGIVLSAAQKYRARARAAVAIKGNPAPTEIAAVPSAPGTVADDLNRAERAVLQSQPAAPR